MLDLRSITTGKDAPAHTPEESLYPSDKSAPTAENPKVGWNAKQTPPPDAPTPDESLIATQKALDTITGPINTLTAAVEVLAELMREQRQRERATFRNITLATNPQLIRSEGRPYNALIVSTAGGTLTVLIPGQDSYNKTLVAGWNILNVPDGTALSIGSGTLNAQLVRSYDFLGNPL